MVTYFTAELVDPRKAVLGEGPAWMAESNELLWIDIIGGHLHFADEAGTLLRSIHVGGDIGVVLPGPEGMFLFANERGLSLVEADGTITELNSDIAGLPDIRFNDGKTDPRGRVLVGTMSYSDAKHAASFYHVDPGAKLRTITDGITCSNGLDWSPDRTTLYYIDTLTYRVDAFDYDIETGEATNRRPAFSMPTEWGYPDGMCIDHDGGLWVAFSGGSSVRRFTRDGEVDVYVEVPVPGVTSCAFGGSNGDVLFITTTQFNLSEEDLVRYSDSGGLYAVRTGHSGPPATPWTREAVLGG